MMVAANDGTAGRTLFVQCGQSNATTHADKTELTVANATFGTAYPNVQMSSKQAIDTATAFEVVGPMVMQPLVFNGATRMGFEESCLRACDAERSLGFALVRYAVGGSSSVDWTGYQADFIAYVQAAKVALGCSRVVILWEQGEADARNLTLATNYQTWLTGFVTAIRTALGAVPFVYGLLNAQADPAFYPYKAQVRACQVAFQGTMPDVTMVNQDGVNLQSDLAHYDANGYVSVGYLFAIAAATYCRITIPPTATFTFIASSRTVAFTDTSVGRSAPIVTYAWTMGGAGTFQGGTTAASQNPIFAYTADGTYNVQLTTTDSNGRTATSPLTPVPVIGGITGVDRDPIGGVYVPADPTQWRTFLDDTSAGFMAFPTKNTPRAIYLCQETTGALADSSGNGIALAAANAPAYRQVITGLQRVGVLCADGTAKSFSSTSSSLPDIATTSALALAIIATPAAAPAANRNIIALGTAANRSHIGIEGTTGKGRATSAANVAVSAASICNGGLHIVANRINRGVLEDDAYVDASVKITPTAGATMTGQRFEIGAQAASLTSSGSTYAYVVLFDSQDWSDAEVQGLITKMYG